LQAQGGHTGTWNTGPVEMMHEGAHTPAMGTTSAAGATTAMPVQRPGVRPDRDEGPTGEPRRRTGRRAAAWGLALFAASVGAASVLQGVDSSDKGGGTDPQTNSPAPSLSQQDQVSEPPPRSADPPSADPYDLGDGQYRQGRTPSTRPYTNKPTPPPSSRHPRSHSPTPTPPTPTPPTPTPTPTPSGPEE
ncbi:serine/threonine protein kinase, partial [Streptomyces sp. NPDC094438]